MTLMGDHKRIERRNEKERAKQAHMILAAILKKVGPVVLEQADFALEGQVQSRMTESGAIEWRFG